MQVETPVAPARSVSVSVSIKPNDSRCRYWAKIIRSGDPLPIPSLVNGGNDIPGDYLRRGDEELFVGDLLIEGEANHHRRERGWSYWVSYVDKDGSLLHFASSFTVPKAAAKQQGLAPELLAGSGDVAGAVRVGHALRLGLTL